MLGLGFKPRNVNGASVLPELAAANNIDASARGTGLDSSPGLGLARPAVLPDSPSQPVDAPSVPSPDMPQPSAAPAAAPAQKPLIDYKANPLGAIGLVFSAMAAGMRGDPSPVAALQKQQLEEQAMGFKTAEFGLNVIEAATKQLKGRPKSEHGAIIADFDKRFSPALGGMSIKPMLDAISSGQIKDAEAKLEAAKQTGLFTPAMLQYLGNDPESIDKVLSAVIQSKASAETPGEAGAKAGAVAAAQEGAKPRETQVVNQGDKQTLVYKDTGQVVKEFPVGTTEAEATAASNSYNLESDRLRSEFTNNSKPFVLVRDAYSTMKDAAKQKTPASDLAIVFGYMKMLDPTSVVREGEQATAQNAPGVSNEVRQWWNQAINGQPLLDSRRKDIMDRAKSFYTVKENLQKQHESEYARLAKSSKIKPEDVVVDYKPKELQTVNDPAAAMKLAPGTHFLDSSGVERIRP